MYQAKIALLDQIIERQAAIQIVPRNADHQPQIGFDHVLAGNEVAAPGSTGEFDFLRGSEQRRRADLVQIDLRYVFDETGLV